MLRRFRLATTCAAALAATATLVLAPASGPEAPATAAAASCPAPANTFITRAPGAGKTIALTFDDGPTRFTVPVLKVLRAHNVRATFFQTGAHASALPRVARQVAAEGHLLADHTWSHAYPSQVPGGWSRPYLADQFSRTNALLRKLSGRRPCFFRPPGGHRTPGMLDVARGHGMSTVMWSVDTEDWKQPGWTSAAATGRVVARARTGLSSTHPLVLLHDGKASREPESRVSSNRSNTVAALPAIIRAYRAQGYRFVDLAGRSGLPPGPTTLALTTKRTVSMVAGNKRVVVAGTLQGLTGPLDGRRIEWFSRPVGTTKWNHRGHAWTDGVGHVRIQDRPARSKDYQIRFAGTPRWAAATSPTFRRVLVVQPRG
jgi:peptidoglycan/xylan/chitin deacetylase (PgdA/CDA1 family)